MSILCNGTEIGRQKNSTLKSRANRTEFPGTSLTHIPEDQPFLATTKLLPSSNEKRQPAQTTILALKEIHKIGWTSSKKERFYTETIYLCLLEPFNFPRISRISILFHKAGSGIIPKKKRKSVINHSLSGGRGTRKCYLFIISNCTSHYPPIWDFGSSYREIIINSGPFIFSSTFFMRFYGDT